MLTTGRQSFHHMARPCKQKGASQDWAAEGIRRQNYNPNTEYSYLLTLEMFS